MPSEEVTMPVTHVYQCAEGVVLLVGVPMLIYSFVLIMPCVLMKTCCHGRQGGVQKTSS